MQSERIALLGYRGFVGKKIFTKLMEAGYEVIGISKETYQNFRDEPFDIVINAATPSKRYWALQNPIEDFEATVRLTADIVYNWKWKKLVQISTVSARCQLDHPYGINKLCAEVLVLNSSKNNLVFRLGALFGDGLNKGVIFDMINQNPIYLTSDSKYNFISTDEAAEIIVKNLDKNGVIEAGARDQISLQEISTKFNMNTQFGDRYESQFTLNPEQNYPKAEKVFAFITKIIGEKYE